MPWSTPNVLGAHFDQRFGRFGGDEDWLYSLNQLPGLAAFYDMTAASTVTYDTDNLVSSTADVSGNSNLNALVLNGAAANYAASPDSNALDVTNDLDIWFYGVSSQWVSDALDPQYFVCKYNDSAGRRSYMLTEDAAGTGKPLLTWSANGTTTLTATSTEVIPFANLAGGWLRVTLDKDNGSAKYEVKFYTSTDSPTSTSPTWTQLGDTVVGASTTSIYAGTCELFLGVNRTTSAGMFRGLIYRAIVKSGINGTTVFDANFTLADKFATSFAESSSNAATVTVYANGANGARIAGERDLYQATAANQPVYLLHSGTNYGWLNGTAGNYFSTPDSAAMSVTGDIDLRVYVALADWTPVTNQTVFCKDDGAEQRSWNITVTTTGAIRFQVSLDGTTVLTATSSAVVPASDLQAIWIRVTRDATTGAVNFYSSADQETWTPIGTEQSTTTGAIFDGTAIVAVGLLPASSNPVSGIIYRAQLLDGIDGTLASDFNPSLYTSGSTFTASTGEVWTVNGGAHIVTSSGIYFAGVDEYLKAATFTLAQPTTVYLVGSQVTWTDNDVVFDGNASDSGALKQTTSTPNVSINAGSEAAENTGWVLKTPAVITSVLSGASSSLRVNLVAATTGNAGTASMSSFTLASAGTAGSYGNVFVSRSAIFSVAHDTATQNKVIAALARGLSISL